MSESYAETAQVAHERDPRDFPWGYFSYGDAPGGIGGGTGALLWFASHRDMLDFFVNVELGSEWLQEAEESHRAEIMGTVRSALAPLEESRRGLESALAVANAPLRRLVQLEWWGWFEELVSGSSEFALHLRSYFRSSGGEDGGSSPIQESDMSQFIASLIEHGT